MMKDEYIKVTPVLRKIVRNYLDSKGYKNVGRYDRECIAFNLATKLYTDVHQNVNFVSFEELLKLVEEYKHSIIIGHDVVEFTNEGINVGRQYISIDKIQEINKSLKSRGFNII